MPNFRILIYSLIFVIKLCSFINCEELHCDMSNLPFCLNKSHILCKPFYILPPQMSNDTINAILKPLNDFRHDLRRYQFLCNLRDFRWNIELAIMARETLKRPHSEFCYITADYKNVLYFSQKFHRKSNNDMIQEFIKHFTNQINPNPYEMNNTILRSWMFSAYSTEIGCAQTKSTLLHCMVNGIELQYFNQSFGYHNECNTVKSVIGNNIYDSEKLACTDHVMCNFTEFKNINESLAMDFTTTKFILNKFDKNKHVAWDIDLQYFAERVVNQTVTKNDKRLALRQYSKMSSINFSGVQYFREQISNIDSIWMSPNVGSKIGCISFNTFKGSIRYFHLYCLTGNEPVKHSFTEEFLKFIQFNESDYWLIYVLLILTYLDIIAVLVGCQILKTYERKRLLFSCDA